MTDKPISNGHKYMDLGFVHDMADGRWSWGGSRFQSCHGYLFSAYCIWPPLTFKAPAPKLIISDEFNSHLEIMLKNKEQ